MTHLLKRQGPLKQKKVNDNIYIPMGKNITEYKFVSDLKELSFIDEIWLFGSRARGDSQDRADIDLAIICPNATDEDWTKVLDIIENADTLLKIDCVRFDKTKMSEEFYNNIIKDKKVL